MYDYRKLKAKIMEVFGSQTEFAKAMGLGYTGLSQRLNNHMSWKTPEIVLACELLGIPLEKAHAYFFVAEVRKPVQKGMTYERC